MSRARSLALSSSLVAALAVHVHAGQVVHSTTMTGIPLGGSASSTLPQFDTTLGVLREARLTISCNVSGSLGVENTTAGSMSVGGYTSGAHVGTLVPWQFGTVAGGFPTPNPAFTPDAVVLAAYDGATDYTGASGVTHAFANAFGDGNPAPTVPIFADASLQQLVGAGTVPISVGPTSQFGPGLTPGVASSASLTTNVTASVLYLYDAFPAQICRSNFAAGCPCNNPGAPSNGCANSANALGGNLAASGVASIANDTLELVGSGMTNSTALYFQGTSFAHAQIPFGDGLRCVTGNVRRLGTRQNVGGASTNPGVGGAPISVSGQVTQPGLRAYQVYYRDAQSYCTSATFNATSGLAILWTL